MKAIEFIRKFGWENAVKCVNGLEFKVSFKGIEFDPAIQIDGEITTSVSRLKTYVDAYELVHKHGGINEAIEATGTSYISPSDWDDLNQAITLVEEI